MPNWPPLGRALMRRFFGREEGEPAQHPGRKVIATGAEAVVATETLISEAIYRFSLPDADHSAWDNAFGVRVQSFGARGNSGATSAAAGLTLAGRRAAVLLRGAGMVEAGSGLGTLAARSVPLVLHATTSGAVGSARGSLKAITAAGAVVLVARNAQEAVDLTLVARRVAEQALAPFVVVMDAAETAWAPRDVALPEPDFIRDYLGRPDDEVESCTPAQRLLFGDRRRRLPAWFDLDRPIAHGVSRTGADLAAAGAGQQLLFGGLLEQQLGSAMDALSAETGRDLSPAILHQTKGARHVLVAVGAAIETAVAVADHLAGGSEPRVGVIGVTTLQPFPTELVRSALASAQTITALERGDGSLPEGGILTRTMQAAIGIPVRTATYGMDGGPLSAGDLSQLLAESANGNSDPRVSVVHLGIEAAGADTSFPARQVHLQALERACPELADTLITAAEALDLAPEAARAISVWWRARDANDDLPSVLASALESSAGIRVRAHTYVAEEGAAVARVAIAREVFHGPGEGVDACLIEDVSLSRSAAPLADIRDNGKLILASSVDPETLWASLPDGWRRTIQSRGLEVFTIEGGKETLASVAASILSDTQDERLARLDVSLLPKGSSALEASPLAGERFRTDQASYDNVPHFWNTVVAPRVGGEDASPIPDPLLAIGIVPPSTSAFHDATIGRSHLPRVDADKCIGCGQCWVECPDSAIATVAVGVGALLDAAADMAAKPDQDKDEQADKLRRAHRQLATRLDGALAKDESGALQVSMVREAFEWLVDKMGIAEGDRPGFDAAFEATASELAALPLTVTDLFFKEPHAQKKGTGELLMVAIDPRACQGCGGCATTCPEDAITMEPANSAAVAEADGLLRAWTKLPDTSGATIARASELDVGPLSAVLMSRHCLGALAGGDSAEPGSGERLAVRLVAAVVEHHSQRRVAKQLGELANVISSVQDAIDGALAVSVSSKDLSTLDDALGSVPSRPANFGALIERLDELGTRSTVDRDRVKDLVSVGRQLEDLARALGEGPDGFGRARFGVVIAPESIGQWAAHFPRNAFSGPVAVDVAGDAPELARGIRRAMIADHVGEARLSRLARLLAASATGTASDRRKLADLAWDDLSDDERTTRSPLIVFVGPEALSERALPSLSRLLASRDDIKVVLVEGRDRLPDAADPVMLALSHRTAFVLSTSIAHPSHMYEGLHAALSFEGPALIHINAPSPSRHGFGTDQTVDRARRAVASRVHPLLRYDPNAPGLFGARLSLEGNAQPEQGWASEDGRAWTPARWALGEERFSGAFAALAEDASSPIPIESWVSLDRPARGRCTPTIEDAAGNVLAISDALAELCRERYELFCVLQELAGVATPFTESVRAQVHAEVAAAHGAELDALRAEYESKLATQRDEQQSVIAARLKARLLELSGLRDRATPSGSSEVS